MKAGRPAYHVRSKWITLKYNGVLMYFELDSKGNLTSRRGNMAEPHHVLPMAQMPTSFPPVVLQEEAIPQVPSVPAIPRIATPALESDIMFDGEADLMCPNDTFDNEWLLQDKTFQFEDSPFLHYPSDQ
jgi:hypothetical protein